MTTLNPKKKKKPPSPPKPNGRPSGYTQELADFVCDAISVGGKLKDICKPDNMPDSATVYRWLAQRSEFCEQYARAQNDRTNLMAEEILELADKNGGSKNMNNKVRLQIDTRKWLMSKMAPKKYGDKLELAGNAAAPLTVLVQRFVEPKLIEDDQNTK